MGSGLPHKNPPKKLKNRKNGVCFLPSGVQKWLRLRFFFIIYEIFTAITLQDWVGWGIFTVIPGYPGRANGDSQHLEARPELQDWLQFELFSVKKIAGQGPFRNT